MRFIGRSFALLGPLGLGLLAANCSSTRSGSSAPSAAEPSVPPATASVKIDRRLSALARTSNRDLHDYAKAFNVSFDATGEPLFKVLFKVTDKNRIPESANVAVNAVMGSIVSAQITRQGLAELEAGSSVSRVEPVPRMHLTNEAATAESSFLRGSAYQIAAAGDVVSVPFTPTKAGQTITFKMIKNGVSGGELALTSTINICADSTCAVPLATATGNDAGGDARLTYTFATTTPVILKLSAAAGQTGAFALQFIGDSSQGIAFGTKAKATGKDGTGIIVGLVDTGIDWCHPDFIDPVTKKSRILYIWDHTLTAQNGEHAPPEFKAPPAGSPVGTPGVVFGVEYTNDDINNSLPNCATIGSNPPTTGVREQDVVGHGSHTAGTSAGNGQATNDPVNEPAGRYAGAAPGAQYIIVRGLDPAIDGETKVQHLDLAMDYVKIRAEALGKPYVINDSWGSFAGDPQDGSTNFEQAVSAIAGQGKVPVFSAGNDGNGRYVAHNPQTISAIGTTDAWILRTLDPCDSWTPNDAGQLSPNRCIDRYVSVWGEAGDDYDITITAPDATTHTFLASDADPAQGLSATLDGVEVDVAADTSATLETNGARAALIKIWHNPNGVAKTEDWQIGLTRHAGSTGSGIWYAYSDVQSESASRQFFYDLTGTTAATAKTTRYLSADGIAGWTPGTLGSPGTGLGVIDVGAMSASDVRWFNDTEAGGGFTENGAAYVYFGELANMAYYSGKGPARDGRILPNVVAPGTNIHSSASRWAGFTTAQLDRDGEHVAFTGTSMACPNTVGVIAQILQVDPTNFPRPLLKTTAVHDAFTNDSAAPDGWLSDAIGKVDAKAALAFLATDKPPVATGLTAAPATSTLGDQVTFTATATDPDGNNTISEYLWDVDNDGYSDYFTSSGSLKVTSGAAGAYTAKVTVVDNGGRTATTTTTWTVNGLPDAGADGSTEAGGGGGGDSGVGDAGDSGVIIGTGDSGTDGSTNSGGDSGTGEDGSAGDASSDSGGNSGDDAGTGGNDSGTGGDDSGSTVGNDSGTTADSGSGGMDSGSGGVDAGLPPVTDGGEGDAAADGGTGIGGGGGGCGCTTAGQQSKGSLETFASLSAFAGIFGLGARRRRRAKKG